jgi:glucosamine-6-phosphate deaminase
MKLVVHQTKRELGEAAAAEGIAGVRLALEARGKANIILATGVSQYPMLEQLKQADIDWGKVTAFHLDEYIGLAPDHPASFRRYIEERFLATLPTRPRFIPVNGDSADTDAEVVRLGRLIAEHPIDVCFAGIGENGHLAFNDPPADFVATDPYLAVELDEACRRQQMGEGWFPSIDAVPRRAISMSIRQIMASRKIVLSVPDARKAEAVRGTVEGPVSPLCPASILQQHPDATLHLDTASASLLTQ